MTVIAIALGVGILTGVNVTADSIERAVNVEIYTKLGENDVIVRGNRSIEGGWFNYQQAKNKIQDVDGVDSLVPRIIKNSPSYPLKNNSGGWNVPTIALQTDHQRESYFGKCNISDALQENLINTSKIEDLFQANQDLDIPVVLSEGYANRFNLTAGDPLYVFPENTTEYGSLNRYNTTTWLEGTIIGIIKDTSEAVRDYEPPAKVWELYPPSEAIYVDIDTAWEVMFNDHEGQVNMIFVHVDNPGIIETVRNDIEDLDNEGIFPGGIFTTNAKGIFTEGILQVNFLMRGIFSIFSAISLLVCALIIKNLLEMSKEENTHEIGIMRAVGVTKSKIIQMYLTQILFISIVGGLLGILFGYYISSIFVGSYVDTAKAVGTDFSGYDLSPVMTAETALIGLSSGILVSIVFGLIPARDAANIDPLDALRAKAEKPKQSLLIRTIKKGGKLSMAIAFTAGGAVLVGSAFGGLFLADIINPEIIVMVFAGVLLLIIGIILLAAFIFPLIVPFLSYVFNPLLQKMRKITSRNLRRYSKQTKNTFAMLAIGISMMITVGTIMNSAYVGAYPGGRTIVGGDLRVGNFDRGMVYRDGHQQGLRDLPSVEQAVPMRFSLGVEGLTRIDRLANNRTFGGKKKTTLGTVDESFQLGIFDPAEYNILHSHDSIVRLGGSAESLNDLMERVQDPYTTILHTRLARRLGGIEEGETVRMRFDGFEADFTVVGIFDVLPGFYWSYYDLDDPYDKQFCGAISWETYEQMVDENIGKIDIVAKNEVYPPEERDFSEEIPEESLAGYLNTPIDYKSLENLASQTGLVKNTTRRVASPFWGIPPFKWQTNLTTYDPNANLSEYYSSPADEETFSEEISEQFNRTLALQNVMYHESGSISPDWNTMVSKSMVIDPQRDRDFGNTNITRTIKDIPNTHNESVEDIFSWAQENYENNNYCVLNEIYVNVNVSTLEMDYVKRFIPGETIRIYYNDTIYTDFTVIATTNSHYPFQYTDENGEFHGDTAVFNYKGMSFNPIKEKTGDWSFFFEVLDVEPNTIFLPNNPDLIPENVTQEVLPDLIDQYLNGTLGSDTSDGESDDPLQQLYESGWLNQTLEQTYFLNQSTFDGELNTTQWAGNYSYNGETIEFDGAEFTYQGEETEVNFTLPTQNGTQILESIANGSTPLELENFTSLVYFDLDDNMTYDDIKNFIESMEAVCDTVPTLENVTLFCPKLFLLEDSGLFNVYFFVGTENKGKINDAAYEIENYYINEGLGWEERWLERANEQEEDVGGFLSLITNMFFGVLSFALIVSLVGLAISTIISIKKRYAEIGTLRTLGFSKKQIMKMVIGEGTITAIYGIAVGLITGLVIAGLVIANLPFMVFLPMLFTPPYELIFQGIGLLIVASIGVSIVPGFSAVNIDISEAIRSKGQ